MSTLQHGFCPPFQFLILLTRATVSLFSSCRTRRQLCYQHGISAWHCMSWWYNEIKVVTHTHTQAPTVSLTCGNVYFAIFVSWVRGIFSKTHGLQRGLISLFSVFEMKQRDIPLDPWSFSMKQISLMGKVWPVIGDSPWRNHQGLHENFYCSQGCLL